MFSIADDSDGSAGTTGESVYQRALGVDFARLPAPLQEYFGPIPAGAVGVGKGRYTSAGYRGPRWLRPALRLSAARDVLFPEVSEDVPFTVENRMPRADVLCAERTFALPGVTRRMVDAMTTSGPGMVVDRLGRRGGLEVRLRLSVGPEGLRLTSSALAARVAGTRIPLPPFARVIVDERTGPDAANGQGSQHVDVRVRVVLLGEVFRYTGSFVYRILAPAQQPPVARRKPSLD
ncbi:DUF4166 domain-containing protein [Microbacterium oleivorans]|uniref:DUF4166 domain-containing protein n=1 Tax=Microbacterium oleivorans TaxID=273677 RepID=A0A7D5EUZ8_9MICO|nr:DUF4166 domain-containing protein [Microbacterium oleivorans]QLD10384.1 DUF4166 domain-containing protein [Microbacterium oleivorans]